MQGEIKDFAPACALFAPDEYLPVVAGAGEDVTVFGMCPGDGPDCAFVSGRVRLVESGKDGRRGMYPLRVSVRR